MGNGIFGGEGGGDVTRGVVPCNDASLNVLLLQRFMQDHVIACEIGEEARGDKSNSTNIIITINLHQQNKTKIFSREKQLLLPLSTVHKFMCRQS